MIDIHNHVLPGVDDGARDEGVMQAMLLRARSLGFSTLVATPHLPGPLDTSYADRVRQALEVASVVGQITGVTVQQGFEVVLSADLPRRLADGEPITLGDSNAVLIELPVMGWATGTEATLFALQTEGYRVVIAHPERYYAVQDDPDLALQLAERGVILQVTLTSLVGIAGKAAQRTAETLIRCGAVQIAATDAHSTGRRYALVPAALKRLAELVGSEGVQVLLEAAPAALLANEPLPAVPIAPTSRERRSWFRRLRRGDHD